MCFIRKKAWPFTTHSGQARATGLHSVIATDMGTVRTNNEDCAVICVPQTEKGLRKKGVLFLLADGMGGHNSGEVASEMAVTIFAKKYYSGNSGSKKSMLNAVKTANRKIYKASCNNPALRGMGTTLTALSIIGKTMYMAHIGDSRLFTISGSKAKQETKDHTWVQHLFETGELTGDEAANHPQRNLLTNALGTKPHTVADIIALDSCINSNDAVVLCSDGLYEYVSGEEIAELFTKEKNIEKLSKLLVTEAKIRGGHDNITVLIISGDREANSHIKTKETLDNYIPSVIKTA